MRSVAQSLSSLPSILSSAISSIRWPLDSSLSPPLYFEPLDSLQKIRNQKHADGNIRLANSHPLVSNLPTVLEEMFPFSSSNKESTDKRAFGCISVALILLGNGLTDEAHDLVTPLSWAHDTQFGYGPSIYTELSSTAKTYATYVHCLVHRREGSNVGEFGMVGWDNANYWSRAVLQTPGVKDLPHREWIECLQKIVEKFSSDRDVQKWAKAHGMNDSRQNDVPLFETKAINELCSKVMKNNNHGSTRTLSHLREFAEEVVEMELRVLLAYSLKLAGFDCSVPDVLKMCDKADSSTEI